MRITTTILLILFIAVTLGGCFGLKREANSYYHLSVTDAPSEDEDADVTKTVSFENDIMRATIRPTVSFDEEDDVPLLLEQLLALQFLIIEFTIENKSDRLIIYNPSHTAIMAGAMDYKKPLDYAKLYYVLRDIPTKDSVEKRLRTLNGVFHDLNTRVRPGKTISRYLIFKPLAYDTTRGNAILSVKELYVGTEAIAFTFPLKVVHTPTEDIQ